MDRIDLLMAEYCDLRSEISRRGTAQLVILGGISILAVALVPVYSQLIDSGSVVLLAVPYVFTIGAWLHVSQDLSIISTATYLYQRLRPAIVGSLDASDGSAESVLAWGTYQGDVRSGETMGPFQIYTWGMRYLAVMGPAVGFTVWGLANLDWEGSNLLEQTVAVGLVFTHLLLLAGVAVLTRSVPAGYRSITQAAHIPAS